MILIVSYIGESELDSNNPQESIYSEFFNRESVSSKRRFKVNIDSIKNKETKDKDKINELSSIPLGYAIEMLRSFQDLLQIYKQNLFIKVSELLNNILIEKKIKENAIKLLANKKRKNKL